MFSLAAKLYLAIATFAAFCGVGYFAAVGERSGWVLLLVTATAALVASVAGVVGGVDDRVARLGEEPGPLDRHPVRPEVAARPSLWPFALATATTVVAVGTAAGVAVLAIGAIALVIPLAGWFAQSWREHPTFTPRLGRRLDDRLVSPVLLPVGTFLLALLIAVSMSRLLLAVDKNSAALIAIAVAVVILGALYWVSTRPGLASSSVLSLTAVGVVILLAGGVAGAAMGEREFHIVGEEHDEGHGPEKFVAEGSAFVEPGESEVHAEPGAHLTWHFENLDDGIYHNIAVYEAEEGEGDELVQGKPVFNGRPIPSGEVDYEFEAPEQAGTYIYVCDFHVLSMRGELVVE